MSDTIAAYWDDYAAAYDQEPDHGLGDPATRAAWRELLAAWLPPEPSTVADLACGTGSLTLLAAELGHTVEGVDLSTNMVQRARTKTASCGDRVHIVQADVADPPLRRGSVDVVMARHILWTLPDPHASLRRWVNLVRPGGRLILVEGRWSSVGDEDFTDEPRMPWAGGVRAVDLRAAIGPLVSHVEVLPLTDPVLWGKELTDERYLLVATRDD